MLLVVDIGNTQSVLGLFKERRLCDTWRLSSDLTRTSDELSIVVGRLLEDSVGRNESLRFDKLVIASVVPALTQAWIGLVQKLDNFDEQTEVIRVDSNVAAQYSAQSVNAHEVGADRIANALAAQKLYDSPAIVVDFGTATNIDVIDEQGHYCGGVISPGLQASAAALFSNAARLSSIELKMPAKVLGTDTKTAVQSGLVRGEAAKVDTLIQALREEQSFLNATHLPVIATGGLASHVLSASTQITHYDEHLTLKGLCLLAEPSSAPSLLAASKGERNASLQTGNKEELLV